MYVATCIHISGIPLRGNGGTLAPLKWFYYPELGFNDELALTQLAAALSNKLNLSPTCYIHIYVCMAVKHLSFMYENIHDIY